MRSEVSDAMEYGDGGTFFSPLLPGSNKAQRQLWSPGALLPGLHLCRQEASQQKPCVCVISGIRQAAEPLCDRVGVPDLGNAPAEDHEIQELVPLAPGACHVGVGSPQGQRQRQDGHQASHPQSGVSVHTQ